MNTCLVCTTNPAESVCFCRWPLQQFLCPACVSTHTAKPTSGYPHRPKPITHLSVITTKELFDDFVKHSAQCEKVKFELTERVAKVGKYVRIWESELAGFARNMGKC